VRSPVRSRVRACLWSVYLSSRPVLCAFSPSVARRVELGLARHHVRAWWCFNNNNSYLRLRGPLCVRVYSPSFELKQTRLPGASRLLCVALRCGARSCTSVV